MIKKCIKKRRHKGKGAQKLQKLRVYRNGATASERYTFFNIMGKRCKACECG